MAVFLCPGLTIASAPRTAKVKVCRRQPPEAARSDLDGSEHGRNRYQKWDGIDVFFTGKARDSQQGEPLQAEETKRGLFHAAEIDPIPSFPAF